ncbi:MAG: ribulose-phosphate 3-epimerase [Lachnospiraceae bacterium]|nr:ribulose-phosphate 3-epimerase [Lachnospiraceae bacterium]
MRFLFAPSILSADFTKLGENIAETERAGAQLVHIDVMDGIFVPNISFGMPVIKSIRKCSKQIFDVHMMVDRPERFIKEVADCGADIITFHYEATDHVLGVISKIHACGKKAGLAIKPNTSLEEIKPFLRDIDMLLIMTVEPGLGGQSYIPSSTEKIKEAREYISNAGLEVDIEVDGGIKLDNVDVVLDAGANVIVAGSAVYKNDIYKNTADFMKIFHEKEL